MKKILLNVIFVANFLSLANAQSNISSAERVQVVGSFNGFTTTPYGTDYRTTTFRKLSITPGSTPVDGRGQWATTINAQASGGDITPINMPGGAGGGFLLISGPSGGRFNNKWAFGGVGQGAVDGINFTSFSNTGGGTDMGMNMSIAGFYTFVFNDCGYTFTNASYYLGYTSAAPVNVSRAMQTVNANNSATIAISTSVAPSSQQNIFVRYTINGNFAGAGSSSVVQATGSGTSYSATIPVLPGSPIVTYYVFTSTRNLTFFSSASESDKSLSVLRYDDNAGVNYSYSLTTLPVRLLAFNAAPINNNVFVKWVVTSEDDVNAYEILKSTDALNFKTIGTITAKNRLAPEETYSYTDFNPTKGNSYYQLLTKKLNGEKKYSTIVNVNIKNIDKEFLVFANADNSILTMRMKNFPEGIFSLTIVNAIGQQIHSQKINRTNIYADESLVLKNKLTKGVYTILLNNLNTKTAQSFIVN